MATLAAEILADTPWAFWKMGEGSGNPADSSGNARPLTAAGTLVYGDPSLIPSEPGTSIKTTSGYFSRTNWWQDFGTTFTLEIFLKRLNLTAVGTIFGANDPAARPKLIVPASSTSVQWFTNSSGSAVTWAASLADLNAHHLVLTYNDTSKASELWVDGVSKGVQTAPQAIANTVAMAVGQDNFTNSFPGWMQYAAIYNSKALSSTRIAAHFAAMAASLPDMYWIVV